MQRHDVKIDHADAGRRLDLVLTDKVADLSRSRIQSLIRDGQITRDGVVVNEPNERVKTDDLYRVRIPPAEAVDIVAQPMALDILFEDEHLLVLVKPAGLVVHPAAGHPDGTLVNGLIAHCGDSLSGIGGVKRPGIVHRLDKDVSGVMVVAKHERAHIDLAGQFSVHSIDRLYEAVVWGVPNVRQQTIDQPIGRHPRDRKRMAITGNGKPAKTIVRLLQPAENCSRVECRLHTGRTHQIRVHLSSLGHSLLGDSVYRPRRQPRAPKELHDRLRSLDRIALHAKLLEFRHPVIRSATEV